MTAPDEKPGDNRQGPSPAVVIFAGLVLLLTLMMMRKKEPATNPLGEVDQTRTQFPIARPVSRSLRNP